MKKKWRPQLSSAQSPTCQAVACGLWVVALYTGTVCVRKKTHKKTVIKPKKRERRVFCDFSCSIFYFFISFFFCERGSTTSFRQAELDLWLALSAYLLLSASSASQLIFGCVPFCFLLFILPMIKGEKKEECVNFFCFFFAFPV